MGGVATDEAEPRGARSDPVPASDRNTSAILGLIQPPSVLASLPREDLLTMVNQSPIRSLPKNRVLFRCGDAGHSLVLVLQGYVKLSTMAANGREVVLEIAGPGVTFGELAVLNGGPRHADATTLTACRLMAIDGALFRRLIGRSPDAMLAAFRQVSLRLHAVTAQGVDAVSLPAPVRLAKALLHLAELHSQQVNGGVHIGFQLSQRELGAMTGLIRESINKHLKAWRAVGWIELSGGSVTLRDVGVLQNFVRDNEAS